MLRFVDECPILMTRLQLDNAYITRSRPLSDQPYHYRFYSSEALSRLIPWQDPVSRNRDFECAALNQVAADMLNALIEKRYTRKLAKLVSHEHCISPTLSGLLEQLPWSRQKPYRTIMLTQLGPLQPNALLITSLATPNPPAAPPSEIPTLAELILSRSVPQS